MASQIVSHHPGQIVADQVLGVGGGLSKVVKDIFFGHRQIVEIGQHRQGAACLRVGPNDGLDKVPCLVVALQSRRAVARWMVKFLAFSSCFSARLTRAKRSGQSSFRAAISAPKW